MGMRTKSEIEMNFSRASAETISFADIRCITAVILD